MGAIHRVMGGVCVKNIKKMDSVDSVFNKTEVRCLNGDDFDSILILTILIFLVDFQLEWGELDGFCCLLGNVT